MYFKIIKKKHSFWALHLGKERKKVCIWVMKCHYHQWNGFELYEYILIKNAITHELWSDLVLFAHMSFLYRCFHRMFNLTLNFISSWFYYYPFSHKYLKHIFFSFIYRKLWLLTRCHNVSECLWKHKKERHFQRKDFLIKMLLLSN